MRAGEGGGEFTGPATRTLIASLVALFFGGTVAIGLFPLLMEPVSATFGWSRGQMGAMAGLSALAAAIGMLIWGALADRYSARAMLLPGLAATSGVFLLLATQSGNLIYGAVCYLLIGFCGAMSVIHVKAQSAQFSRRRGVALGMIGVAVGLSFGVTPLLAKPILDAYGWRVVYAAFAVPPAAISLPLVFAWFRDVIPSLPGRNRERRRRGLGRSRRQIAAAAGHDLPNRLDDQADRQRRRADAPRRRAAHDRRSTDTMAS